MQRTNVLSFILMLIMFLPTGESLARIPWLGISHKGCYSLIGCSLGVQSSKWLYKKRQTGTFSSLVMLSPVGEFRGLLVLSNGEVICGNAACPSGTRYLSSPGRSARRPIISQSNIGPNDWPIPRNGHQRRAQVNHQGNPVFHEHYN